MNSIQNAVKKQILGFALTGTLSTLIMYGLYVGLYKFINYQYAYFIAYFISVIMLYFMNAYVFKGRVSFSTFFKFPLIYLGQYILGALCLAFLVRLGVSIIFAPLIVVIVLLPITFLLNRLVFSMKYSKK